MKCDRAAQAWAQVPPPEFDLNLQKGHRGTKKELLKSELVGPPPDIDLDRDWEVQDDALAVERIYRDLSANRNEDVWPAAHLGGPHAQHGGRPGRAPSPLSWGQPLVPAQPAADNSWHLLPWSALTLGLTAVVCGGCLMAWATWGGRDELWSPGVVSAVAGHVALFIGLMLHLDGLLSSHREQSQALGSLDESLSDLRQTTALWHTVRHPPSTLPSPHLESGAQTSTRLVNLKSQLDELAQ